MHKKNIFKKQDIQFSWIDLKAKKMGADPISLTNYLLQSIGRAIDYLITRPLFQIMEKIMRSVFVISMLSIINPNDSLKSTT